MDDEALPREVLKSIAETSGRASASAQRIRSLSLEDPPSMDKMIAELDDLRAFVDVLEAFLH